MATAERFTENIWVDPRTGAHRTYWVLVTPPPAGAHRGRTYFSFNQAEWHRTFKAAALAS